MDRRTKSALIAATAALLKVQPTSWLAAPLALNARKKTAGLPKKPGREATLPTLSLRER
jgi:hypothetical protein